IITTNTTVTLNVSATISALNLFTSNANTRLVQAANTVLTVNGPVTLAQPTSNGIQIGWHIGSATATVSGLVSFIGANVNSRVSSATITSGQLNANGGL